MNKSLIRIFLSRPPAVNPFKPKAPGLWYSNTLELTKISTNYDQLFLKILYL